MFPSKVQKKSFHKKDLLSGDFFPLLFLLLFFILLGSSTAEAQKKGVYHTVARGDTLYRIGSAYKISIARLMEANGLAGPSGLKVGQRLFIPGASLARPVEPYAPLSAKERTDLEQSLENEEKTPGPDLSGESAGEKPPWLGKELDIIWPIEGKINSPFGLRGKSLHAGIDIASPSYQEVKAAMDGEVLLARNSNTGYGNVVVLRHDLGFTTVYGHMNVIIAREGEAVRKGQAVGGVGSTGRSTGPHLHFELRHEQRPIDPRHHLPMTLDELLETAAKKGGRP
jgi:murein DD-endopeptidase MepM/ murein hydrolase activator NlpD